MRIDRLATGRTGDGSSGKTHAANIVDHCQPAEYVPELLTGGVRRDLKPLDVLQPESPSFQVNGGLVEWHKWRLRVGFNPREGATLHDVHYDGRSVLYRLVISEMASFSEKEVDLTLTADGRQCHMPTHEIHFHGSKHLTLVTVVQETAPTISPLVAIASVPSRYVQIPASDAKVIHDGWVLVFRWIAHEPGWDGKT